MMKPNFIHTYLSVDCVVFGFDNEQLNILLVRRNNIEESDHKHLKLPGSLIFDDEDVDNAALRVLNELTGIKRISLKQFRCFANPNRASKPQDVKWLDKAYKPGIDRLVTVAYLALCKIDRKFSLDKYKSVEWCPISNIPQMPFDHNEIVEQSLIEIRKWIEDNPVLTFELLPQKFTISQLHKLYESIYDKTIDIRNFHKKVVAMNYVVPLTEKQQGVAHRAARLFKFDKKEYNKLKNNI